MMARRIPDGTLRTSVGDYGQLEVYMNRRWEAETDRVRRRTSPEILEKLDRELERNVRFYGGRSEAEITQRIAELEKESSIERYLNTNASALGLAGAVLGLVASRKWLLLSAAVGGFLLKHAVSGWCPPVPLLRRL